MKKLLVLSFATLLIAATSCKKVTDDPISSTSPYKTMTTYMVDNDMDLPDILTDWIVGAPASVDDVDAFLANYDVIDIENKRIATVNHRNGTLGDILSLRVLLPQSSVFFRRSKIALSVLR